MNRGRDDAVEDIHQDLVAAPFPHEWGKRADAINRVPTVCFLSSHRFRSIMGCIYIKEVWC